ncbi:response regulator transcription factor [Mucilaginibacter sp. SP1R1]|uniref:response regulator transcription factor n=1 Tax=Mucilaginibacter sp. SP1R1 TaxID=2723091 RepID=UPI001613FC6D|nr:response regulator transcription factor [Mucilaginibacter sp. SP1R1]MBB6148789.1 DNA-binding NarL/FixJ family response regulator [Mucilaginibacter sp. SP1R1]
MTQKIRIAIADDSTIFRDGLKVCLNQDDNLEVVLEAGNGAELLEGLQKNIADVILMDLKMPVMDGMEATREVKKKYKDIKVIAVTMYGDDNFVIHLMENGANGYLLKNADPPEIGKAIHAVHQNGYYFNDIVSTALLKKLVIKGNVKPSFNTNIEFSERELEVLNLICNEKTTVEIGKEIFLSPRSVEGIRQRLIEKIGVRNTAGLVMFAVKNGII